MSASPGESEEFFWEGELTAASVPAMADAVERRMAGLPPDSQVRIDLRGVPFADSSGLGLMVAAKKRAWQRGIRVGYINPTPNVASLLRLSRLEAFLIESPP